MTMCNSSQEEFELRRGPWTLEEDNILIHYISCHGEGRWNWLAKCAGLRRTGKSCRLRWLNYLKPDIKHGNLTPHEQLLILELHSRWGNRWSKIAQHLPGRTDNEIKNYWRTRVQKQARQLKVDANSKTFLEVIRCFWMPRLLDKMGQSSSSSSSSSSTMENKDSAFAPLTTNHAILGSSNADMKKLKSSNCSSERALNLPATEENQIPAPTCRNNGYSNSIEDDDCYYLDIASYNSSDYISDQQAMSAMGCQDVSLSEYLMYETDWFNEEVAGSIWYTDELWQFRKAGEILSPENDYPTMTQL